MVIAQDHPQFAQTQPLRHELVKQITEIADSEVGQATANIVPDVIPKTLTKLNLDAGKPTSISAITGLMGSSIKLVTMTWCWRPPARLHLTRISQERLRDTQRARSRTSPDEGLLPLIPGQATSNYYANKALAPSHKS